MMLCTALENTMEDLESLFTDVELESGTIHQPTHVASNLIASNNQQPTVTSQSQWCQSCHGLAKEVEEKYRGNFIAMKQKIFFTDNLIRMVQNCKAQLQEAENQLKDMTEKFNNSCSEKTLIQKQLEALLSKQEPSVSENNKLQEKILSLEAEIEHLKIQLHAMDESRRIHEETIKILKTQGSDSVIDLKKKHQQKITQMREFLSEKTDSNKKLRRLNKTLEARVARLKEKRSRRRSSSTSEYRPRAVTGSKSTDNTQPPSELLSNLDSSIEDVVGTQEDPQQSIMKSSPHETTDQCEDGMQQSPHQFLKPAAVLEKKIAYITSTTSDESADETSAQNKDSTLSASHSTNTVHETVPSSPGSDRNSKLKSRMLIMQRKRAIQTFIKRPTSAQLSSLKETAEVIRDAVSENQGESQEETLKKITSATTSYCSKHFLEGHERDVLNKILDLHERLFSNRHIALLKNSRSDYITEKDIPKENTSSEDSELSNAGSSDKFSMQHRVADKFVSRMPDISNEVMEIGSTVPMQTPAYSKDDFISEMPSTAFENIESDALDITPTSPVSTAEDKMDMLNHLKKASARRTSKHTFNTAKPRNAIETSDSDLELPSLKTKKRESHIMTKSKTENKFKAKQIQPVSKPFVQSAEDATTVGAEYATSYSKWNMKNTHHVNIVTDVSTEFKNTRKRKRESSISSKSKTEKSPNLVEFQDSKPKITRRQSRSISLESQPEHSEMSQSPLRRSRRISEREGFSSSSENSTPKHKVKDNRVTKKKMKKKKKVHSTDRGLETSFESDKQKSPLKKVTRDPSKHVIPIGVPEPSKTEDITSATALVDEDIDESSKETVSVSREEVDPNVILSDVFDSPLLSSSDLEELDLDVKFDGRVANAIPKILEEMIFDFGLHLSPIPQITELPEPNQNANADITIAAHSELEHCVDLEGGISMETGGEDNEVTEEMDSDILHYDDDGKDDATVVNQSTSPKVEETFSLVTCSELKGREFIPPSTDLCTAINFNTATKELDRERIKKPLFTDEKNVGEVKEDVMQCTENPDTQENVTKIHSPNSNESFSSSGDSLSIATDIFKPRRFSCEAPEKAVSVPPIKPMIKAGSLEQVSSTLSLQNRDLRKTASLPSHRRESDVPSHWHTTVSNQANDSSASELDNVDSVLPLAGSLLGDSAAEVQKFIETVGMNEAANFCQQSPKNEDDRKETEIRLTDDLNLSGDDVDSSSVTSNDGGIAEAVLQEMTGGNDFDSLITDIDSNQNIQSAESDVGAVERYPDKLTEADASPLTVRSNNCFVNMTFSSSDESATLVSDSFVSGNHEKQKETVALELDCSMADVMKGDTTKGDSESLAASKVHKSMNETKEFCIENTATTQQVAIKTDDSASEDIIEDVAPSVESQLEDIDQTDSRQDTPVSEALADAVVSRTIEGGNDPFHSEVNTGNAVVNMNAVADSMHDQKSEIVEKCSPVKNSNVHPSEFVETSEHDSGSHLSTGFDDAGISMTDCDSEDDPADRIIIRFIKSKMTTEEIGEEFVLDSLLIPIVKQAVPFNIFHAVNGSEPPTIDIIPSNEKKFIMKMIALHKTGCCSGRFIPGVVIPTFVRVLKHHGGIFPQIFDADNPEADRLKRRFSSMLVKKFILEKHAVHSLGRVLGFLCRALKAHDVFMDFSRYTLIWQKVEGLMTLLQVLSSWPQGLKLDSVLGKTVCRVFRKTAATKTCISKPSQAALVNSQVDWLDQQCEWSTREPDGAILPRFQHVEDEQWVDVIDQSVLKISSAKFSKEFELFLTQETEGKAALSSMHVFDTETRHGIWCLELLSKEKVIDRVKSRIFDSKFWPILNQWSQHLHLHGDSDMDRKVSNVCIVALLESLGRIISLHLSKQRQMHKNQPPVPQLQQHHNVICALMGSLTKRYQKQAPRLVQCAVASFLLRTGFCNPSKVTLMLREWLKVTANGSKKTTSPDQHVNLKLIAQLSCCTVDTIQKLCSSLDAKGSQSQSDTLVSLLLSK